MEISAASTFGFAATPVIFHWFDIGTPYRPEGMQWPTRAHDHARTGAYEPPVRREVVPARVLPSVIAGRGPGAPLVVALDLPEDRRAVDTLSLVAVDGKGVEPLSGERRGTSRAFVHGPGIFLFDREAVRARLATPGSHALTFRTDVIDGAGGVQIEATASVNVLDR